MTATSHDGSGGTGTTLNVRYVYKVNLHACVSNNVLLHLIHLMVVYMYIYVDMFVYSVCLNDRDHIMDTLKKYVIDEVPHKWKKIATALGFTYNKVSAIESDTQGDHDRLWKVFGSWLRREERTGKKDRTLESLYSILSDNDCRPEAESLLEHFPSKWYMYTCM